MNETPNELKSLHLEERKHKRDAENTSILESMNLAVPESDRLVVPTETKEEVSLEDKPETCGTCRGSGQEKGLFHYFECSQCHGTGYDLSDPIAIIKWQKLCNKWAKEEVISLRQKVKQLEYDALTEEERAKVDKQRLGESVDRFYGKLKDNYRGD